MDDYIALTRSPFLDDWSQDSRYRTVAVNLLHKDQTLEVIIDENLTASDFCSLMTVKLSLNKSVHWFVCVRLPQLGLQRILEDWEEVFSVYKQYQSFKCILIMEQYCIVKKFEFFDKHLEYFPIKMLNYQSDKKKRTISFGKKVSSQLNDIKTQLKCFDKLRVQVSGKLSLGLGKKEPLIQVKASFNSEDGPLILEDTESNQRFVFDVNKYQYFCSIDDKLYDGQFGFCLIHESCNNFRETTKPINGEYKCDVHEIIWLHAEHENERNCWLTIFNLSKYGLGEYRACFQEFKKKKEKNKSLSYLDMSEGKVLIDYGYKDGARIIEDHSKDLVTIVNKDKRQAVMSDHKLKKCSNENLSLGSLDSNTLSKTRSSSASTCLSKYLINSYELLCPYSITNQSDLLQPWFYLSMTREEAIKLLSKYECLDGVFLIRASRSHPFNYVLSFVHHQKVIHCQIKQIETEDTICLSLDLGITKFYNLQQLIEFYQLNDTCLPTKLTYFLVHRHNPCLLSSP